LVLTNFSIDLCLIFYVVHFILHIAFRR